MNKKWTEREKQYIRDHYTKMKDREIAVELSGLSNREISVFSVRKQRQKMKLKKAQGRPRVTKKKKYTKISELLHSDLENIYKDLGIPSDILHSQQQVNDQDKIRYLRVVKDDDNVDRKERAGFSSYTVPNNPDDLTVSTLLE